MAETRIENVSSSKVSVVSSDISDGGNVHVDQSERVTNIYLGANSPEQPANVLVFDSSDTLAISKIMQQLTNDGVRQCDCTILINGYDNYIEKDCFIAADSAEGHIDGYIRSLWVEEASSGQLLEVGGCNATSERIAAKDFKLVLSNYAYTHLTDSVASYYDQNLRNELDHRALYASLRFNEPQKTIAIAKQLRDETSLTVIVGMLKNNAYSMIMSHITESFKVFKEVFDRNKNLASETLHHLQSFIRRNVATHEYSNSVVYAIESLGYISRSHRTLQINNAKFILNMLSSDNFLTLHRDILWSSLVSLQSKVHTEKELNSLSSILSEVNLDNENIEFITTIGNSLVYESKKV